MSFDGVFPTRFAKTIPTRLRKEKSSSSCLLRDVANRDRVLHYSPAATTAATGCIAMDSAKRRYEGAFIRGKSEV